MKVQRWPRAVLWCWHLSRTHAAFVQSPTDWSWSTVVSHSQPWLHMEVIRSEKNCTIGAVQLERGLVLCVVRVERGCTRISRYVWECRGVRLGEDFHLGVKLTWLTIQERRWQDLILFFFKAWLLLPSLLLSDHLSLFLFILFSLLPCFLFATLCPPTHTFSCIIPRSLLSYNKLPCITVCVQLCVSVWV